jgi:hypothetical protein
MAEGDDILAYKSPEPPRPPRGPLPGVGLAGAIVALFATQCLWMIGLGTARQTGLAMVIVLSVGGAAALAGAVSGFRRQKRVTWTADIGDLLLGLLNSGLACFLGYAAVGILRRMLW